MKSLPTLDNSAKGFTLLEVVVAMTIVGLGIVTLLQILSLGLRLGARSTVRTEVVTDGGQVMDEFLARGSLQEGTERGTRDWKRRGRLEVRSPSNGSTQLRLPNAWSLNEGAFDVVM